jgi:PKD domain
VTVRSRIRARPVAAVALLGSVLALLAASYALLAPAPAAAHRKFIGGIVADVPTGTRVPAHTASLRGDVLPYGGGPVLHSNRTHVIFWDPAGSGLAFDPGYEALVENFLIDVADASHSTTNTYGLTGQYTDSSGPAAYDSTYGGSVVATDPLPPNGCTEPANSGPGWTVCLTDAQLESEIEHVIDVKELPRTDHDIYFLLTPDGFGSCTGAGPSNCALGAPTPGSYCGYHSETGDGVLYAVIPYPAVPGHCESDNPRPNSSTADPTLSTISHEQIETVTDPYGNAWIDGQGNEIADLCLTNFGPRLGGRAATAWNETIHGGHFFLQEIWSNADSACEPRAEPDVLSLSVAALPGRPRSVSLLANGSDPEGRIVGFQWFFEGGRTAFGPQVTRTFRQPGSYRVVVRATDSWANWAYAKRTVRIKKR